MKSRIHIVVLLLGLAALTVSGCGKNIVRAAPPSVTTPPPSEPAPRPVAASPAPVAAPEMPATMPAPVAISAPTPAPARPRPAPVAAAPEPPKPTAAPTPQISPMLTPQAQQRLTRQTTDDIVAANRNLRRAEGIPLNASQNDLVEKVQGFLKQADDAIRANDWVRAQGLAQKAQVLSADLVKSL
jgi:hypothetical protein